MCISTCHVWFFYWFLYRALSKLVSEEQNNWDDRLEEVLFAIRTKKQSSTKFSPFFLLYGREAVFPSQLPKINVDVSIHYLDFYFDQLLIPYSFTDFTSFRQGFTLCAFSRYAVSQLCCKLYNLIFQIVSQIPWRNLTYL